MIACDVPDTIGRCIESVASYVDEVIIVITHAKGQDYPTKSAINKTRPDARVLDFTYEEHPEAFILDSPSTWKKQIAGPFTEKFWLSDFSAARNFGWKEARSDYVLWLDADDVFQNNVHLPSVLEDMRSRKIAVANVNYDYDVADNGEIIQKLTRERIVSREARAQWRQPVHEVLVPSIGLGTFYEHINVRHMRRQDKREPLWHQRNLKILTYWFEKWETEGKSVDDLDPRMLYYMGCEARFVWPEYAVEMFEAYCKRSGWDEERATAHSMCATLHEQAKRWDKALAEHALVTVEFPDNPDGFFGLGRCAYWKNDWIKVIEWTEKGFEVEKAEKKRTATLPQWISGRKWQPHVYLSKALIETRNYTRAIQICEEGLKAHPNHPHLLGNLQAAKLNLEVMKNQKAPVSGAININFRRDGEVSEPPIDMPFDVIIEMVIETWKRVYMEDVIKGAIFLSTLPESIKNNDKIKKAIIYNGEKVKNSQQPTADSREPTAESQQPTAESRARLRIAIYTGPAWEKWSPASLGGGLGGSETAAIFMAQELTRLGHNVVVYGTHDGLENDVCYIGYKQIKYDKGQYDVFISSRFPGALIDDSIRLTPEGKPRWKVSILWAHDTHYAEDENTKKALLSADKILVLSQWHKMHFLSFYPYLQDTNKIVVTRNGIATGRFAEEPKKIGNRLIYSNSPDRGLERLLEIFPDIRKRVPDAELHVYYGFDTWEKVAQSRKDTDMMRRISRFKDLLEGPFREPNVYHHGRIGQQKLARIFSESKVWAYPTWFTETSCITAMEAQAAGCVPVTTALAALPETVKHGFLIPHNCMTPEYRKDFVDITVKLLTNEVYREEFATAGRRHALANFGWEGVAKQWEEIFWSLQPTASSLQPETEAKNETFREVSSVSAGKAVRHLTPDSKLRIAVILGNHGTPVHGIIDVANLFEEEGHFATGTVTGFVQLAWGLAERGHTVDAFSTSKENLIDFQKLGGVNFYDLRSAWPDETYDAYISINEPNILEKVPANKLRLVACWLNGFSFCTPLFDRSVDVYVCPSETHKRYTAKTGQTSYHKLEIIPLCTSPELHIRRFPRQENTIIYCSSPDRGLHNLLTFWPKIRAKVPDAKLDIYYRLLPWYEDIVGNRKMDGTEMRRRADIIMNFFERHGKAGESGVTLIGPVGPRKMAEALGKAALFVYPAEPVLFTEGFGTAVLEACAAGCPAIISSADALVEVYADAAQIIWEKPSEKEDLWVESIVDALKSESWRMELRMLGWSKAKALSRKEVAKRWEELILRKIEG